MPSDADIVIEGYVDPSEDTILEGPFGDHTGFYSLADWFPVFHMTCITHRKNAVYPATIVGIPPQEDAWLAKATEKIFLAPLKLAIQPEITDFHMPDAGVAHNLVIVTINKAYPGQGKKVISSLLGAVQMMFTKYIVVVSSDVDIRNYHNLLRHIQGNADPAKDLLFASGPLDVLDHASDVCALGGKLGLDATVKLKEEISDKMPIAAINEYGVLNYLNKFKEIVISANLLPGFPVVVVGINQSDDPQALEKITEIFSAASLANVIRLVLVVDSTVDINDWYTVVWQILGNTDPCRDLIFLPDNIILIDGTIKAFKRRGFSRKWPNVVCSDENTVKVVDLKWDSLGLGPFIPSPSLKSLKLVRGGRAEVNASEG